VFGLGGRVEAELVDVLGEETACVGLRSSPKFK
jgi:hypothetical protein